MTYEQLERIVRKMQAVTAENGEKRAVYIEQKRNDLLNACVAESVGIGKALSILVEEFPDDMAEITAPQHAE